MADYIYENDNYYVVYNPEREVKVDDNTYVGAYELYNKDGDILEFATPGRPEVLHAAVQFDVALSAKAYEWPYRRQAGHDEALEEAQESGAAGVEDDKVILN